MASWCNGNTVDSDSTVSGSTPGGASSNLLAPAQWLRLASCNRDDTVRFRTRAVSFAGYFPTVREVESGSTASSKAGSTPAVGTFFCRPVQWLGPRGDIASGSVQFRHRTFSLSPSGLCCNGSNGDSKSLSQGSIPCNPHCFINPLVYR